MDKKVPEIRFEGFSDEWEQREFSNIVNRITTSSNQKELPRVEYEDIISGKGCLNKDIFQKKSNKKGVEFISGDILFGKLRPYLKNWLFADFNGIAVGDFWVLRPHHTNGEFIYSLIQSEKYQSISNLSTGTKMPRSDWKLVSSTPFDLPSNYEEQKKIGSFLAQIDNAITLQQHKLEALQQLKQALLQKLFPSGKEKVPQLRFAHVHEEWEQRKLKNLSEDFEYGLNANAVEYDGENKYIRITDIEDKSRRFKEDNLTSPNTDFSSADNYLLKEGDILFARTGASVGKSYQYNPQDGKVYYAGFLIRARIKSEYDASFIFQNTLTYRYKKFISITSQRSGQPGVNAREYGNYSLMIPGVEEQFKVGRFLNQVDDIINLRQRKLEKLELIKKGFLQKMFV